MDTVTPAVRSRIMSSVKAFGNKSTEEALRLILKQCRITGWRRKYPLLGKPDFVFPKEKKAVFVDGCLWHGCARHCRIPLAHRSYWKNKIGKNKARDMKINKALRAKKWIVIRIWEHEIKSGKAFRKIQRLFNG